MGSRPHGGPRGRTCGVIHSDWRTGEDLAIAEWLSKRAMDNRPHKAAWSYGVNELVPSASSSMSASAHANVRSRREVSFAAPSGSTATASTMTQRSSARGRITPATFLAAGVIRDSKEGSQNEMRRLYIRAQGHGQEASVVSRDGRARRSLHLASFFHSAGWLASGYHDRESTGDG